MLDLLLSKIKKLTDTNEFLISVLEKSLLLPDQDSDRKMYQYGLMHEININVDLIDTLQEEYDFCLEMWRSGKFFEWRKEKVKKGAQ